MSQDGDNDEVVAADWDREASSTMSEDTPGINEFDAEMSSSSASDGGAGYHAFTDEEDNYGTEEDPVKEGETWSSSDSAADENDQQDLTPGDAPAVTDSVPDVHLFSALELKAKLDDVSDTKTSWTLRVASWALETRITRENFSSGLEKGMFNPGIANHCASKLDNVLKLATDVVSRILLREQGSLLSSGQRLPLAACLRFWCSVPAVAREIVLRNQQTQPLVQGILTGTIPLSAINSWTFEMYAECWHSVRWFEAIFYAKDHVRLLCQQRACGLEDILFIHVMLYHDFFRPFRHRLLELGMISAAVADVPVCFRSSAKSPAHFPLTIFESEAGQGGVCRALQERLKEIRLDFEQLLKDPVAVLLPDGTRKFLFPIYFGCLTDGKARNDVAGFTSIGFSNHPCVWCDIHADEIRPHIFGETVRTPTRRSHSAPMAHLSAQASAADQSIIARAHIQAEHGVRSASQLFLFPHVDPCRALETLFLDSMHAEGSNDCQAVIASTWHKVKAAIPNLFEQWSENIQRHPWVNNSSRPPRFSSFNDWLCNLTAAQKMATMRTGLHTMGPIVSPLCEQNRRLNALWRLLQPYFEYFRLAFGHVVTKAELQRLEKVVVLSRRALIMICGKKEATINVHFVTHLVDMIKYHGHVASHIATAFENCFLVLRSLMSRNTNGRYLVKTATRRLFLQKVLTSTSVPLTFEACEYTSKGAVCVPCEEMERALRVSLSHANHSFANVSFIYDPTLRAKALSWNGINICRNCGDTDEGIAVAIDDYVASIVGFFSVDMTPYPLLVLRIWQYETTMFDSCIRSPIISLSNRVEVRPVSHVHGVCEVIRSVDHPSFSVLFRRV